MNWIIFSLVVLCVLFLITFILTIISITKISNIYSMCNNKKISGDTTVDGNLDISGTLSLEKHIMLAKTGEKPSPGELGYSISNFINPPTTPGATGRIVFNNTSPILIQSIDINYGTWLISGSIVYVGPGTGVQAYLSDINGPFSAHVQNPGGAEDTTYHSVTIPTTTYVLQSGTMTIQLFGQNSKGGDTMIIESYLNAVRIA